MVYITYTITSWDLPDIYARTLGPAALGQIPGITITYKAQKAAFGTNSIREF